MKQAGPKPKISAFQAACAFKEMLEIRREFCDDDKFFKAVDVWEDLANDEDMSRIRIKPFKASTNYKPRKAGVIAFGDNFTLVVPKEFLDRARNGGKFENYTLAHELTHIALDHHSHSALIMNFQLSEKGGFLANVPPDYQELEANFGAVFLQCGNMLFDTKWSSGELARRAFSDEQYVRKAQRICRLPEFQKQLDLLNRKKKRVIL